MTANQHESSADFDCNIDNFSTYAIRWVAQSFFNRKSCIEKLSHSLVQNGSLHISSYFTTSSFIRSLVLIN
ncbi:hypothetical protein T09_9016 [Trichinella sp. T9]|nr:hypothetical protein T09_9016 [Trichinella sp. T9]